MPQSEISQALSPVSSITSSITCEEALPCQDNGIPRLQKPARIVPPWTSTEATIESSTDSGYSSQSTSPGEKRLGSTKDNAYYGGPTPFLFFKKKRATFIDKPIDQLTRDYFKAIQPYFEKLLLEEICAHQKPGTKYKPISMRLGMMGTTENDARPHIVVLCQLEHKRLIKGFVKKEIITDIYRSKDAGTPVFKVIVIGNAPRLRLSKSNIEVVTNAETIYLKTFRDTLCGVPISFQHPNGQRRNATFGGIIKVMTASGDIELLDQDMLDIEIIRNNYSTVLLPHHNDIPFNNDATQNSEMDEEEDSEDELHYILSSELPDSILDGECTTWDFNNPAVFGQLIDVLGKDTVRSTGQCYDWVLFQPFVYKMNRVPVDPKAHLSISNKRPGATGNRRVIVLSGSTDCKFVDSFMVTIDDGPGIRDGDSGSWVIDATRFEIYGQLVATDMFGGGYVIPMTDILSDIKSQLGAQAVELPNFVDILHARTMADKARSSQNDNKHSMSNGESAVSILKALKNWEEPRMEDERLTTDTRRPGAALSCSSPASEDSGYGSIGARSSVFALSHFPALTTDVSDIVRNYQDSGYASLDATPKSSPLNGKKKREEAAQLQAPVPVTSELNYDVKSKWKDRALKVFTRFNLRK
ncbi:hypothetical protein HD806DRAFT_552014 [Xylariaceae sp. AK1471]|nr:hypothetical protein HD806DRAFT_552014 [Xylariaceae sp. AK1471]